MTLNWFLKKDYFYLSPYRVTPLISQECNSSEGRVSFPLLLPKDRPLTRKETHFPSKRFVVFLYSIFFHLFLCIFLLKNLYLKEERRRTDKIEGLRPGHVVSLLPHRIKKLVLVWVVAPPLQCVQIAFVQGCSTPCVRTAPELISINYFK